MFKKNKKICAASHFQKKILLIQPPIQDFYQTQIRQEPLGLAFIQAALLEAGFDVMLLNCLETNIKKTIRTPVELDYMTPFYPTNDLSPFKIFGHFFHFGLSFEDIYKKIKEIKPDFIGISANFTPYFPIIVQIARLCKQYQSNVPVVVGGHHVSANPAATLLEQAFDFVIIGEGEVTFCQLAQYFFDGRINELQTVPGLGYRENGEIRLNLPADLIDDLDSLTMPQYAGESTMKMILTSRGCPKSCQFCSIHQVMGKKIRIRSIENVIDEMNYWTRRGIKQFDFEDDNLLFHQERAKNLLVKIIHHFGERNLLLSAMNGLSADHLNTEILKLMALAGFKWLNLPLVSGACTLQKALRRNQSHDQFFKIIELAEQFDLKVVGYLILGLPEDTIESMLQDILTLAQQRLLLGPSIFYPPPGSETYRYCVQKKYIQPYDYIKFRSTAVSVETENFKRVDIVTLFRLTRLINYLKELIDSKLLPEESMFDYYKINSIDLLEKPIDHRLNRNEIGAYLIKKYFHHRDFHGLRLDKKVGNQYYYKKIEYVKSKSILEFFSDNLPGLKFRGVHSKEFWRV